MGETSEAEDPKPARSTTVVLARVFDLFEVLFKGISDRWVLIAGLAAIVAIYGITLNALPPQDRLAGVKLLGNIVGEIKSLVTSDVFSLSGWGLLFLLVLAGAPYVVYQHKRNQNQGKQLAECRERENQERLTSRRPEDLARYEQRSRSKFGPESDK